MSTATVRLPKTKTEISTTTQTRVNTLYPLLKTRDRLSVWQKIRGLWQDRWPDPIQELEEIRSEWERDLPSDNCDN